MRGGEGRVETALGDRGREGDVEGRVGGGPGETGRGGERTVVIEWAVGGGPDQSPTPMSLGCGSNLTLEGQQIPVLLPSLLTLSLS